MRAHVFRKAQPRVPDGANFPLARDRRRIDPQRRPPGRHGGLCEAGEEETARVREAAAALIIEAYNQGVRDQAVLAHHALRTLRRGRPGL